MTVVSTTVHVKAADIPVQIETHGNVTDAEVAELEERLERVLRPVSDRIVTGRALLSTHHERGPDAMARVRVTLHARGETVRSEVVAPSIGEASSSVEERLRRQIEHLAQRAKNDPRGKAPKPGEWRHGNLRSPTHHGFDRPSDERAVIVRKSPSATRSTQEEAMWDRFILDYDFFLYVDAETGRDTLITSDDATAAPVDIADQPTMSVADARTWIDQTGVDLLFFTDEATNRGAVIYLRYDGHYGLLTPGS